MDSLLDKTESWQDVFINYSIPNTRKFEQIARENAIAKKQELQALVSKSYRDVMNTADTIIQMHRQMDLTMDQISAMRITCTGISLQKRIKVTRYMESNLHPSNNTHSTFRFIHECLSTSRKMQCCNKILPACRLFLVCQKLVAYLSSHSEMRLPRLRDDLAFHKLSLANAIDRVSTSRDSPISTISASLCAFALVAGSSTIDTLKYFLNARKKYIYNQLVDGDSGTRVHALMQIISSTMHDSVVIFTDLYPHLANLICSAPIIQDVKEPEIDLNLIKHLKDHLDTFVPWIKADPLPSSIISGICQQWLKDVTRLLKENIGLKIAGYSSIKGILAEENEIVLMIHIDDEASAMADCWNFTLKPCVHERILELFNQSLQQFTSLSVDIESTDSPVLPLWNTTVFLESSQPHILVKSLDLAAKGCTHQLQTFWDKHYTIVLAINADLELLHKNVDGTANLELLGEIEARIQAAYEHIQLKLTTVYQSLYSPDCAQICALLRVISRFRAHPLAPSQYRPSEMFGLDLVECMSEELAELVMGKHISRYSEFLNMQTWSTEIPEAALFEGSPGIPQNPLAAISVLLAASCRDIAMLGPDLLLDDLVQRFRFKILQDVDHISRRLLENCKVENIAIDKNIELPQPKVDQQSELVDGNDELDQPKFDGNNTEQSETVDEPAGPNFERNTEQSELVDGNDELDQPKFDENNTAGPNLERNTEQSELVDGNDELDEPKFDGNNTEQSELVDGNDEFEGPKLESNTEQSELVDGHDELEEPKFDENNTELSETKADENYEQAEQCKVDASDTNQLERENIDVALINCDNRDDSSEIKLPYRIHRTGALQLVFDFTFLEELLGTSNDTDGQSTLGETITVLEKEILSLEDDSKKKMQEHIASYCAKTRLIFGVLKR